MKNEKSISLLILNWSYFGCQIRITCNAFVFNKIENWLLCHVLYWKYNYIKLKLALPRKVSGNVIKHPSLPFVKY